MLETWRWVPLLATFASDISAKDHEGMTPLYRVVRQGPGTDSAKTAIKALLDAGATPNDGSLHEACHRRDLELVQLLLDRGHDPYFPSSLHNNQTARLVFDLALNGRRKTAKMQEIEKLLARDADTSTPKASELTGGRPNIRAHPGPVPGPSNDAPSIKRPRSVSPPKPTTVQAPNLNDPTNNQASGHAALNEAQSKDVSTTKRLRSAFVSELITAPAPQRPRTGQASNDTQLPPPHNERWRERSATQQHEAVVPILQQGTDTRVEELRSELEAQREKSEERTRKLNEELRSLQQLVEERQKARDREMELTREIEEARRRAHM